MIHLLSNVIHYPICSRCQAATVAVTTAIALMLQNRVKHRTRKVDASDVIKKSFAAAEELLDGEEEVSTGAILKLILKIELVETIYIKIVTYR